ncbi:hypothetical protein BFJ63_vAg3729 [Fusarium oxysporum f. sp. narcissi]|uniref:Uncharacterized protein n=2 Tax=Fusarium oxysporum TaxID=5507 RepID=A0A4Q2W1R3_FUSOX|nr:hypothetical protein BFJ65_g2101 [Fusarium oxysporum f. sp. cepae]RKL02520.1 hypothetical protein BFJ71_g4557 [Fusarium oxysporum]RYC93420.1 hypothetical protein BFJ63_vAg3729 [Fusarium oxysporum f. sp. narcissi]RKK60978.1 hypothetical protein BFJ66_g1583 [Fusarium oxysporum f. sp. cepae]RKK62696.1 hypothetical protein BFJ67_g1137 [Fusarium oxysporum f. sp. cepae]
MLIIVSQATMTLAAGLPTPVKTANCCFGCAIGEDYL